ncbi:MAG TPA: LacI family DNA-binding transcriptional regulator [Pyrinomonadaceae bacterium]|jgi:LacI family transcriptional regulator
MRIKDVAREAGVSTATVSHVINKTKYVTDATRYKVLRAIETCNYYPNANARTLASGRSNIIGLLVSDIANPFFPELIKSVEAAAFERGYNVILLNTNYDATRAADYVRRLIELKVAGVALMTSEIHPPLIDELEREHVRVVFHNLGTAGEHMSNIRVDYAVGIEEAVRHLVSLGHRQIVHIAGPGHFRSALIRREAFLESVARHLPGQPPPQIYEGDFKFEGGRRAACEILGSKPLPTAVVVSNDMMALGAMQELRAAGLMIPRDISVVGFDDIAFAAFSDPPLTTICSPRTEIGRRAVEALMMTIERPDQPGMEIRIPTYLVTRSSTAPPPPAKAKRSRR